MIAILAAISIVAYNGIQNRARVTTLVDTIAKIDKGMRLYITAEGTGGWPLESSFGAGANPNINTIIADTELSNYLQTLDPV